MRIIFLCLVSSLVYAEGALAQELNPNVLAPAARHALPKNRVVSEPPYHPLPQGAGRGMAKPNKHRRTIPPRPPIQNGESQFWPWD